MEDAAKKLERFFMMFLFINPFLDIIGGIYLKIAESVSLPSVTPSLLVRMGMLLLFAVYIIMRRNWRAVLTIIPVGVVFALSLLGELMFYYSIDFYTDIKYIIQFAFNITVIMVYATVFRNTALSKKKLFEYLNKTISFAALLLSSTILLSYVTGVGSSTYGDRFGYRGSRGFFYSGNDITAVLMLLLPITFVVVYQLATHGVKRRTYIFYVLAPAVTIAAQFLIGTKTSFMAAAASVGSMLVYAAVIYIKKKDSLLIKRFVIIMLAAALSFGLLMLLTASQFARDIKASLYQPGVVMDESGLSGALFSGRLGKLEKAVGMWKLTTPYSVIFGVGRGTQAKIIEMDIFEVLLYYGLFGGIVMLWLYLKLGVGFLLRCFEKFDLTGLGLLVSLGLCVGYFVMAGHVLFSVTSGFYFAFMLVYAHLYYAVSPKKLKVI